jgi:hypothetical protein
MPLIALDEKLSSPRYASRGLGRRLPSPVVHVVRPNGRAEGTGALAGRGWTHTDLAGQAQEVDLPRERLAFNDEALRRAGEERRRLGPAPRGYLGPWRVPP